MSPSADLMLFQFEPGTVKDPKAVLIERTGGTVFHDLALALSGLV